MALIQAHISPIEFDYTGYGELRLAEYWAWREIDGSHQNSGDELSLREQKWAQEA